jgi:hypothetical protein
MKAFFDWYYGRKQFRMRWICSPPVMWYHAHVRLPRRRIMCAIRMGIYKIRGSWHRQIKDRSELKWRPCGSYILPDRKVLQRWVSPEDFECHENILCGLWATITSHRFGDGCHGECAPYQRFSDGKWVWLSWQPLPPELALPALPADGAGGAQELTPEAM